MAWLLMRESVCAFLRVLDGFKVDFAIALWRGGCFIGSCMHEAFKWKGLEVDHVAIRTSKYYGVDQARSTVQVHSLGYLSERLTKESKVLIIDDIFDTGHTLEAVLDTLRLRLKERMPDDVRIATVYYKESRNESKLVPNYYIHKTDRWIVFPHEVEAMSLEEIEKSKGKEIFSIFEKIKAL